MAGILTNRGNFKLRPYLWFCLYPDVILCGAKDPTPARSSHGFSRNLTDAWFGGSTHATRRVRCARDRKAVTLRNGLHVFTALHLRAALQHGNKHTNSSAGAIGVKRNL